MTTEERLAVVETELRLTREELRAVIDELKVMTAAMHRGKGALAAALAVAGIAGAAVASLVPALFGKG